MTEHDSKKPTRTDIDAPLSREDAEQSTRTHSQTITGRSHAGVERASDQRSQTADHRGESRAHLADDTVGDPVDRGEGRAPRDES
jgi:hypothetical protein